jgi:hypothetical protein
VAREIAALAPVFDLQVAFIGSRMFGKGRSVHASIAKALEQAGVNATWDPPLVRAQTAVFHNPSFLKYDDAVRTRFNCTRAVVVAHENFLRPDGTEGFDVGKTLRLIAARLPPCLKVIAPVSPGNRRTVTTWLAGAGSAPWDIAPVDWFNICDFEAVPPTATPRDRRGRVSRAGFEKFPDMAAMNLHFPASAEHCAILGADTFLLPGANPPAHWRLLPFGSADVSEFLATIDFFVYFTHPNWRESFGRVLAEAIAAGKVVITDRGTARTFGKSVIASDGHDLDRIIADFISAPRRYQAFVRAAQRRLSEYSAEAFRSVVCGYLRADAQREAAS